MRPTLHSARAPNPKEALDEAVMEVLRDDTEAMTAAHDSVRKNRVAAENAGRETEVEYRCRLAFPIYSNSRAFHTEPSLPCVFRE